MNRELIREVRRWHRFAQEDIEEAERQMKAEETALDDHGEIIRRDVKPVDA